MKTTLKSGLAKIDSAYEQQAQAFLDRFGIKFRATLSDSKVAPWSENGSRHHFRVTLSKSSRVPLFATKHGAIIDNGKRITFDFWGCAVDFDEGRTTVTPYDVLACISSDAYCADTFQDWCGEFGESEDSIRALQTYRRCSAFAKRLQLFFTQEEIEALREIQ